MKREITELKKVTINNAQDLEMSSGILTWFNNEYQKTDNENDFVKLTDIFISSRLVIIIVI